MLTLEATYSRFIVNFYYCIINEFLINSIVQLFQTDPYSMNYFSIWFLVLFFGKTTHAVSYATEIICIVQDCLMGLLQDKTIIYVTHQVEFLPAADLILVCI